MVKDAGFVPETRVGIWFLGTAIWHTHVLNVALDDLERMLHPRRADYPVVLDVGCGHGYSLLETPRRFGARELVAVDADPEARDRAAASLASVSRPVAWHVAGGADLPLPDDSVDLVLCHQTLHHIVEQERALAEMYRVLRPGGVLLLAESTRAYIYSWVIRLFFRHPMEVQRTAEEYVAMVRAAGFEVAPSRISTPYLWWSRSDLGFLEWAGRPLPRPGKREETLVNLVAFKPEGARA